jgi:hypothetical protein
MRRCAGCKQALNNHTWDIASKFCEGFEKCSPIKQERQDENEVQALVKELGQLELEEEALKKRYVNVFHPAKEKVLGITWNAKTDQLSLKVKTDLMKTSASDPQHLEDLKLTKRMLLSEVARIYDPIRLAAAFTIRARIYLHELWQLGVGWDEELPPVVKEVKEIQQLVYITFPGCLPTTGAVCPPLLCIFPDASNVAFGACAYIRKQSQ